MSHCNCVTQLILGPSIVKYSTHKTKHIHAIHSSYATPTPLYLLQQILFLVYHNTHCIIKQPSLLSELSHYFFFLHYGNKMGYCRKQHIVTTLPLRPSVKRSRSVLMSHGMYMELVSFIQASVYRSQIFLL